MVLLIVKAADMHILSNTMAVVQQLEKRRENIPTRISQVTMQITNNDLLKPQRQTSDEKVILSVTDQCTIFTLV